ncbi:hypothetical protein CC86DRAFT_33179 [Ophiobolus disseminans]|uniref:Uncharacterized protein n=1 Tax=Ophiobolus disseminans TaxID=1469910 RepID=A0A6A6ZYK2_9PLEO|nr:hypothetical protein CC86DRAFT_33179 [Ophiobolus disseminans]
MKSWLWGSIALLALRAYYGCCLVAVESALYHTGALTHSLDQVPAILKKIAAKVKTTKCLDTSVLSFHLVVSQQWTHAWC